MMKSLTIVAVVGLAGVAGVAGCQKDRTSGIERNDQILAVSPTPPPMPTPTPETNTQNVIYDTQQPPQSPTGPAVSSAPRTYTVKKGETLFGIAKANYGSGKEWQKITAANPGLEPNKLRAGQKITLP